VRLSAVRASCWQTAEVRRQTFLWADASPTGDPHTIRCLPRSCTENTSSSAIYCHWLIYYAAEMYVYICEFYTRRSTAYRWTVEIILYV